MAQLRHARIVAGISQEILGEMTGYENGQISDWECGVSTPNIIRFGQLCEALGLKIVLVPVGSPQTGQD